MPESSPKGASSGKYARVEPKGLCSCERVHVHTENSQCSCSCSDDFLAGTLNAGCVLDHRLTHAVPEQWERSNFELLPYGQSLCTLRTGSALALALFLTGMLNAGCVPDGRTWRLSKAALWQPEWVLWLLVFGSNGNGPISSSQ